MAHSITVQVPRALDNVETRQRLAAGFAIVHQQLTGGMLQLVRFQEH